MLLQILERANSQNIAKYLLYGHETTGSIETGNFDDRIEKSFEHFYQQLKEVYPSINEDDDTMFDLINELVTNHSEIYFEIGFLAGIESCLKLVKISGDSAKER